MEITWLRFQFHLILHNKYRAKIRYLIIPTNVWQENKYSIFCLRPSVCAKAFQTLPIWKSDLGNQWRYTVSTWFVCTASYVVFLSRAVHLFLQNKSRPLYLKWEVFLTPNIVVFKISFVKVIRIRGTTSISVFSDIWKGFLKKKITCWYARILSDVYFWLL